MKVLVLSALYAPHQAGGAERVARTLATGIRNAGDDVVVLTTAIDGDPETRHVDGVRVRSIPLRNLYSFAGREAASAARKLLWHVADTYNPLMGRAVEEVIRSERPDVVHSHVMTGFTVAAWSAARRAGIPVVHTLHDYYLLCARSSLTLEGVPCHRRHLECVALSLPRVAAARQVSRVVGVSRFVLERHRELGAFVDTATSIIPNPCHTVGAPPRASRATGPLRLGFLGRVEANKGIHLLVDAVSRQRSGVCHLSVAGLGAPDYVAGLRARFPSPDIDYLGVVADAAGFLSSLDALVVPSEYEETFGMSAAEALALGVPVIASNRGALPELVADGRNGFIFDPADPGALPVIIGRLAAGPASLATMADACRRSVAHLEPAAVAGAYRALYSEVAGTARTSDQLPSR